MPPELFTLEELVTYSQRPSLPADIATMARELVTISIKNAVGWSTYEALTDVRMFKPIALDVAKRGIRDGIINPDGLRSKSRQIDDYTETTTYASETLDRLALRLTLDEADEVRELLGQGSAFSIAPAFPAETLCCSSPYGCAYCRPGALSHTYC